MCFACASPGNPIGDAGAASLARALGVNDAVRHFRMPWCQIRTEAATAIAEALKVNTGVTDMDLSGARCIAAHAQGEYDQVLNYSLVRKLSHRRRRRNGNRGCALGEHIIDEVEPPWCACCCSDNMLPVVQRLLYVMLLLCFFMLLWLFHLPCPI
jgi:hypothetical protein